MTKRKGVSKPDNEIGTYFSFTPFLTVLVVISVRKVCYFEENPAFSLANALH